MLLVYVTSKVKKVLVKKTKKCRDDACKSKGTRWDDASESKETRWDDACNYCAVITPCLCYIQFIDLALVTYSPRARSINRILHERGVNTNLFHN